MKVTIGEVWEKGNLLSWRIKCTLLDLISLHIPRHPFHILTTCSVGNWTMGKLQMRIDTLCHSHQKQVGSDIAMQSHLQRGWQIRHRESVLRRDLVVSLPAG